jgi:ribose transport system permease protein
MTAMNGKKFTLVPPRLQSERPASAIVTVATLVLVVIAIPTVSGFATTANFRGVCLSLSLIGIIAAGLSFVTISGQVFSLAIPAQVALATICFATFLHLGAWEALLITVVGSAAVGTLQGYVVGRFGADPIIVTIAAGAIMVGLGQVWTNGQTAVGHGNTTFFNSNLFGFLPFQTAAFIVVTFCSLWLLRRTVAGRQLTLLGLNDRAARMSGIRSTSLIVAAFTFSGATTGLAGALLAAQSNEGQLLSGATFGTGAIIAVVVGGVAITGGIGTPLGAAIGAVFVGVLENVASLAGLSYQLQLVTEGALAFGVVVLSGAALREGRSRR